MGLRLCWKNAIDATLIFVPNVCVTGVCKHLFYYSDTTYIHLQKSNYCYCLGPTAKRVRVHTVFSFFVLQMDKTENGNQTDTYRFSLFILSNKTKRKPMLYTVYHFS